MQSKYKGILEDLELTSDTLAGNFEELFKTDMFGATYKGHGLPPVIQIDLSPSNRKLTPNPELAAEFYEFLLAEFEPRIQVLVYVYWHNFRRLSIGYEKSQLESLIRHQIREISLRLLPANLGVFSDSFEKTKSLVFREEDIEDLLERRRSGFIEHVGEQDWLLDYLQGKELRNPDQEMEDKLTEIVDFESGVLVLHKLQAQLASPRELNKKTAKAAEQKESEQLDPELLKELIKKHF